MKLNIKISLIILEINFILRTMVSIFCEIRCKMCVYCSVISIPFIDGIDIEIYKWKIEI